MNNNLIEVAVETSSTVSSVTSYSTTEKDDEMLFHISPYHNLYQQTTTTPTTAPTPPPPPPPVGVRFDKRVKVCHVMHLRDYTKDEIRSSWFTKSELRQNAEENQALDKLDKFSKILEKEHLKTTTTSFSRRKGRSISLSSSNSNKSSSKKNSSSFCSSDKNSAPSQEELKIMLLQSNIQKYLEEKSRRGLGGSSRKNSNKR